MKWYIAVLSKYAQFTGRARRKEYWMFTLVNMIIIYALMFIGMAAKFPYLQLIYTLAVVLPSLAAGVRRMHDINRSGWFVLIPLVNLIFFCTAGTVGPNEYGEDPKDHVIFGADDYEKPFDINANA